MVTFLSAFSFLTGAAQTITPAVQNAPPPPAATTPAPQNTYPQIVRLSYVEGDVRLSRGPAEEKAAKSDWEQAVAGVPLETGYSLVTGTGRAEIEFEDASTVYVGENSVVSFNDLTTSAGIPHSDLGLLSGVMTVHVTPMVEGEEFRVETPTNGITTKFPAKTYARINSYLDGMMLTPMGRETTVHDGNSVVPTVHGQSMLYHARGAVAVSAASTMGDFSAWDTWVSDRVKARNAAMLTAMKASGLTRPVPGLAQMAAAGTFSQCEPYGTCWEPTGGWPREGAVQAAAMQAGYGQSGGAPIAGSAAPMGPSLVAEDEDDLFPCSPWLYRSWYEKDLLTHRKKFLYMEQVYDGDGYMWGVCHVGTWIHREHRYMWVSGGKRHHHCPVRWVKNGKRTGYVPLHPKDVAGKPPLNLKHAIYPEKGPALERTSFKENSPVKLLGDPPKEFRREGVVPLQRAAPPQVDAHTLLQAYMGQKPGAPSKGPASGVAITFDHKSQSFMLARQTQMDGKLRTVSEPMTGRVGGMQPRGDGGERGGASGSYSRAGYGGGNSGGSRGGYSGGGGSRGGGGGYSGGGGGSHGGGGSSGGGGGGGGGSHGGGGGGGGASSGGGSHR
jgi:hypothetical protein